MTCFQFPQRVRACSSQGTDATARPARRTDGASWCNAGPIGQTEGMTSWKPHALAKPHADQLDLSIGDRVEASVDLDGVGAGTTGKVILANGFNWQRYRVLFVNGVEIGDLDARNITPIGKTAKRLAKLAKRP